jgi:hypothetical protein
MRTTNRLLIPALMLAVIGRADDIDLEPSKDNTLFEDGNGALSNGTVPGCPDAADVTDDGAIRLDDAVAVLSFLFAGAAPPPAPFGGCDLDPTPDDLLCVGHAPCTQAR